MTKNSNGINSSSILSYRPIDKERTIHGFLYSAFDGKIAEVKRK